ncbi:MAG: hypothetical protein M2R45_03559 [Verrucomicrobia subdivision 3 bacterium]|nr:hypothetical protein [Limisphaerales bacterium]MCS1416464.1 hypothetical protein [Limisphaerales bacterium]
MSWPLMSAAGLHCLSAFSSFTTCEREVAPGTSLTVFIAFRHLVHSRRATVLTTFPWKPSRGSSLPFGI